MTKVLLVEDDPFLRDAYQMILSKQMFDLTVAENGQEALKKCKGMTYDLILLDIMMPVLDGIGFLEKANLSEQMPNVRIIVFSNLSSGDQINRVKELGAHRILVKSELAPKELITIINKELALAKK
jgi:two-component system chemotaxis response regulator CheY